MPKSKNYLRRIFILDELLRGSTAASLAPKRLSIEAEDGPYTLSDLTHRMNDILRQEWADPSAFEEVSELLVKEDIKSMRENFGVEIKCRVGYQTAAECQALTATPTDTAASFTKD